MKKRILSFGVAATHESIASVGNFSDAMSLSDFDAFVLDPLALQGAISNETYSRRQNEIHDLIALKGGVVLCLLRPKAYIGFSQGGGDDAYGVFGLVAPNPLVQIRGSLRAGSGSHVELLPNARGASGGYLRVLAGAMRVAAYLDTASANLEAIGGTVFAIDSVGHPIAVEFAVAGGRICFLPVADGITGDRVGSAIARVVEAHYGGPSEIEPPEWSVVRKKKNRAAPLGMTVGVGWCAVPRPHGLG